MTWSGKAINCSGCTLLVIVHVSIMPNRHKPLVWDVIINDMEYLNMSLTICMLYCFRLTLHKNAPHFYQYFMCHISVFTLLIHLLQVLYKVSLMLCSSVPRPICNPPVECLHATHLKISFSKQTSSWQNDGQDKPCVIPGLKNHELQQPPV